MLKQNYEGSQKGRVLFAVVTEGQATTRLMFELGSSLDLNRVIHPIEHVAFYRPNSKVDMNQH